MTDVWQNQAQWNEAFSIESKKKLKRQFLDTPSINFFLTVAAQGTEFCGYPLLKTAGDDEK